ncbi:MAG: DUF2007 domain-containing protein [Azospirillaceae bacterium]|nr:DUF2007 domain-containing protein [Azospirillaceae bacterium]
MQPVLRSNDLVELSWARSVLADAGIESVLLDDFTASMEGSIAAIPRRLMVADPVVAQAKGLLDAARADLEVPRDAHLETGP